MSMGRCPHGIYGGGCGSCEQNALLLEIKNLLLKLISLQTEKDK